MPSAKESSHARSIAHAEAAKVLEPQADVLDRLGDRLAANYIRNMVKEHRRKASHWRRIYQKHMENEE